MVEYLDGTLGTVGIDVTALSGTGDLRIRSSWQTLESVQRETEANVENLKQFYGELQRHKFLWHIEE